MLCAGVSSALFESGLQLGRRLGAPSTGPLAGWRRARLARLFDGGATLRLQYPKEDLGFIYSDSGAVWLGGFTLLWLIASVSLQPCCGCRTPGRTFVNSNSGAIECANSALLSASSEFPAMLRLQYS